MRLGICCWRGMLASILVLSIGPKVSCGGRSSMGGGLANAIEERGGRKGGIDGFSLCSSSRRERGWGDMYDQLINFKQNTGEGKMATIAAKICFCHTHSDRLKASHSRHSSCCALTPSRAPLLFVAPSPQDTVGCSKYGERTAASVIEECGSSGCGWRSRDA